jgi:hypothetical protein
VGLFDSVGQLWTFARKIEELLALQRKSEAALELVNVRLDKIEDRMTHLEANQTRVVTEAKAAAIGAATVVANASLVELTTRITRLELQPHLQISPNAPGQPPKAPTPE